MTYDLTDVSLPAVTGEALRFAANIVELPAISAPVVNKLLSDSNLLIARTSPVHEAPAMVPHWPAKEAPSAGADILRKLPEHSPASIPFRRARDFAERYAKGLSPEAVAEAVLQKSREIAHLHPFIAQNADDIRKQARESAIRWAERKPLSVLDGVPIAVKDELDQMPYPSTGGTRFMGAKPVAKDSTVVARLRALGALLIGKANMHEIGIQPNGWNAHYGQARNPYNPAHDSGGSSSGSAVAVAAQLCPIAIGADGGGSVRIPAGLCGIVGLKATFGRVSEAGAVPLCWTVGHIGPLAASVEDTALAYAAIAGADPADPHSMLQPTPSLHEWNRSDLRGLTIGVPRAWATHADEETVKAYDVMVEGLKHAGATIREIDVADLEQQRVAHAITILSEMVTSMRTLAPSWDVFAPSVRLTLAAARALTASDYVWAQRVRARGMAQWRELLTQVDVVLTPNTAMPAPVIPSQLDWSDLTTTIKLMRYAFPGNLLGLPGISFPAGNTRSGLPISVQAMGRAWEEHVLLRVANVAESFVQRRRATVVVDLLGG